MITDIKMDNSCTVTVQARLCPWQDRVEIDTFPFPLSGGLFSFDVSLPFAVWDLEGQGLGHMSFGLG